jgi:Ca2+-binding RTX toxin-like protein
MRRAVLLAVVGSVLLVAFAGVAYALSVQCDGAGDQDPDPGQCQGTEQSDQITGTDVRDVIFALGGRDFAEGLEGDDEINGQNGGDHIHGNNGDDTYNGGNGPDSMHDFEDETGRDVFNGGEGEDDLEGSVGPDILRGQVGDECFGQFDVVMFGDPGNDDLFGNAGEDCMEGDEGTDEHFGGADNDFIDAVSQDTVGTADVVDCGGGVDTAVVRRSEDTVRNCENVLDLSSARVAAYDETTAEEQLQQREAFLVEHGLPAEPGV